MKELKSALQAGLKKRTTYTAVCSVKHSCDWSDVVEVRAYGKEDAVRLLREDGWEITEPAHSPGRLEYLCPKCKASLGL